MWSVALFAGVAGTAVGGDPSYHNDRPVIGILTEPLGTEHTYIAASYVKFAESAGARVVPLHYDASDEELTNLFHQINGIIFPGGGVNIKREHGNRFREAADLLSKLALSANDAHDIFPIHGTCLGFQMMAEQAAEDDGVLCETCYTTEGTPLPLNLTAEGKQSSLFADMPEKLLHAVTTEKITENSHSTGIEPKQFEINDKLKAFYKVLSVNTDPNNGLLFVSTMEARNYPFYATQWHPEKNNFEWGKVGKMGYAGIPHSAEAILLSQWFADRFVSRARQSSHRFVSDEALQSALIYNTQAIVDPNGYFSQIYQWPRRIHPQADSAIQI